MSKLNPPLKKILLVDDDSLVRKAVKRCLSNENYALKTTGSGNEALTILQKESFDVIVADFLMPGLDGCELLIKVQRHWPQMSRILFTASFDNHRVKNCLKDGTAQDIILKPWKNEHITLALHNVTTEACLTCPPEAKT